jgi:hypothetical protein
MAAIWCKLLPAGALGVSMTLVSPVQAFYPPFNPPGETVTVVPPVTPPVVKPPTKVPPVVKPPVCHVTCTCDDDPGMPQSTPEPGTLALAGIGLALGLTKLRRKLA